MARNAKSPTVPNQTPAAVISIPHSIPAIRIEKPAKEDKPVEVISESKPTPPLRSCNNSLQTPRMPRQPRQTSIRSHANGNGNGVMKGPPRETVVNFGFSEDPIPPGHYCCGQFKIQKTCKFVGVLSLFGFIINLILYFLGISKLGLNGYVEVFLLIFDCIAVLTLLRGVSNKRSGLLKPYLLYNTLWSLGLIILFLVFVWHMLREGHDVSKNILENIRTLRSDPDDDDHFHYRPKYSSTTAILVTIGVMTAMILVIVIDCIFLHVVYRTFQFFAYKEDKKREEMDKKERL